MNYKLHVITDKKSDKRGAFGAFAALKKLASLMENEKWPVIFATLAVLANSLLNLLAPLLVGYAIDTFIVRKDFHGVMVYSGLLLLVFLLALLAGYLQTTLMGGVGQRVLFNLRNAIFNKLQTLPVAFFNQNKAGDLISRINNDTDKINQFFSQGLLQFIGNIFMITGSAIFILTINVKLGSAALAPAIGLYLFTRAISAWVKRKNAINLQSVGGMSAEIQESLQNFKVIVAFNRRDYFRKKFNEANEANYQTSISAGIANTIFLTPLYGLASNLSQLIVLAYGVHLISMGNFTVGLLISFFSYLTRFYDPLRHIAAIWSSFQVALAGWDRITDILSLESDLVTLPKSGVDHAASLLEFRDVHFRYPDGEEVLKGISFDLEHGKTYALVGPTGGGKTTTASLMARLYDPSEGEVFLEGRDIRSYTPEERVEKIGCILQEPFLFTGTVRDNIVYGNARYAGISSEELSRILKEEGLEHLLSRFSSGLDTPVLTSGEVISLGQKQLIAFMRAVLRRPTLLILDEATANIDTVTEQLLEDILKKLPKETTRVIIAHRLNTIESADEIFFVNSGEVVRAGSFSHAVDMLLHEKRGS